MSKYLVVILKEMCKRVGADFEKMDFKKDNWFHDFIWSDKEEQDFIDWLAGYLEKNKEARYDVMAFPRSDKKMFKKCAGSFAFNYGWKIKN